MRRKVSAVLLAAGMSRRMGCAKQLLPIMGRPAIVRCLEGIIQAGMTDIVVVVGRHGAGVAEAVSGLPVKVAHNLLPDSEMADSVRAGLGMVDAAAEGVMVCLADHPLVSADTFASLADAFIKDARSVVIPVYEERRGHPAVFPSPLISMVSDGMNLREITGRAKSVTLFDVLDEGVVLDMDTVEDYRRLCNRTNK